MTPLKLTNNLYMEVIDVEHKETQPALAGVQGLGQAISQRNTHMCKQ